MKNTISNAINLRSLLSCGLVQVIVILAQVSVQEMQVVQSLKLNLAYARDNIKKPTLKNLFQTNSTTNKLIIEELELLFIGIYLKVKLNLMRPLEEIRIPWGITLFS